LGEAGADRAKLDQAVEAVLARPELAYTPGSPRHEELKALIERAW
jgi:alcohol dehydrogenase class IV